MENETKFVIAEKSETVDGERSVVGWGSKPLPDRDGELIEASAWDLENFRKNPVLCLSHDLSKPPIGKILWVKADANGLKFKAQFAGTERGKEAYQLYKEGVMNSFSVGFRPKPGGFVENPMEERYKGLKKVFKSVELFEISCVTVPSLPQAVAEYVKSGTTTELKTELQDLITKEIPAVVDADDKKDGEGDAPAETTAEDKIAKLETNIAEMRTKIAELTALNGEHKEVKKEDNEEKTLDAITGQPSVYDIMSALSSSLRRLTLSSTISEVPSTPYDTYVIDLYPTEYPNGYVVYRLWTDSNTQMVYRQGYVFDNVTKKVTLNDDAVLVEDAWVTKTYGEEMTVKGVVFNNEEQKAGKVLSAKIISALEDISGMLTDAVDLVEEILASAKPAESDNSDDTKGIEDEEFELEDIELDTKGNKTDDPTESAQSDDIDLDIDPQELADVLKESMGSVMKELNSTVKEQATEQVNKFLGKATV